MAADLTAQVANRYELPGQAVFPESIGVDTATGDAYVGSLADGTLYQLAAGGQVHVWSPPGQDGRGSVAGVKVDARGRLWVAGGYEGTLYVYDLEQRTLLARGDVGTRPSCVNDIAFGPDGAAYVTDSFVPVLFRADPDSLELRPWAKLAEQGVPWTDGLNLNGIVLTPDGRHLITCQTNLGRFWRLELAGGEVSEVALTGGPLEHCDGLAIDGPTLHVAVNAHHEIAVVTVAGDGSAGQVRGRIRSDAFAFPTAIARRDDHLLVVNSQLDRMGGSPSLPFTVVTIAIRGQ